MNYTKGEWKAEQDYIGDWQVVSHFPPFPVPIAKMCWTNLPPHNQAQYNAHLIAAAPLQNGQLRTGNECLGKVQDIVAEVAKTCSPKHAEMLCVAQSYLCGVIAGNELALAKAEGGHNV